MNNNFNEKQAITHTVQVTHISQTHNGEVPNPIPVVNKKAFHNCHCSATTCLDKHYKLYNKGWIAIIPPKNTPAIYWKKAKFLYEKRGRAYSNLMYVSKMCLLQFSIFHWSWHSFTADSLLLSELPTAEIFHCRRYKFFSCMLLNIFFFSSFGIAAQQGLWPRYSWGFYITHNIAPQSAQFLWMSDQLLAETSTWQHTILTRGRHPCTQQDSNPQSQQASGRTPTPQIAWPMGPATQMF